MTSPVTWPAGLPQRPNAPDFGIEPELNSELFKPDSGVTRGRRKAEQLPDDRRMSFDLTRAQYEDWQDFWRDDLKGGFLPIRFVDPVTGGDLDVLPIGRPQVTRLAAQLWRVAFEFEEF